MLNTIKSEIKPLIFFKDSASKKEVSINHCNQSSVVVLKAANPRKSLFFKYLRLNFKKFDFLFVFTNNVNFNKLYIDNRKNIFLSSGIVLRFLKQDASRFLKKRLKTWYGYIKALKLLQKKPFVLYFKNIFGKKLVFLSKLNKSGVKFKWVFLKLMQSDFVRKTKSSRRIKRWIKKKYYQIEIGEKK